MVDDINGGCEEELIGFILVAPLGSNTFVQRVCSNKDKDKENNVQVSVSSKKVLRPRPVSPSFD
jgi:hypothetical protein